jgi:hypothetical protein
MPETLAKGGISNHAGFFCLNQNFQNYMIPELLV